MEYCWRVAWTGRGSAWQTVPPAQGRTTYFCRLDTRVPMTFKPYSTGVEISRAKHVMVYAPQICTKAFMIKKKNVHIGLAFRNKHNGKTFFKNHPKNS